MCASGSSLRLIQSALERDDHRALLLVEFALRFVSAMEREAEERRRPLKEYMRELRLALIGRVEARPDSLNYLLDNSYESDGSQRHDN